MSSQPDQSSPNTPVAAPRGWLRAAIVAALAVVFVMAAVGFVGYYRHMENTRCQREARSTMQR